MAVTTAEQYSNSTSVTRVVQRRWIRHDRPIWPFVWRGLLPLLGLLLLGAYAIWPFARSDVEASVLRETREQLAAQGLGWVNVDVSGQNVRLSGMQPKAGDGDAALAAARTAVCPSWYGRLTCAVAVSGDFTNPSSPPPAAAAPPPLAATPPAPPAAAVQACEKSLADLLAKSKIEFTTGSAVIHANSAPLLDALTKAVRACPGALRVEGHTDSRGFPAANQQLSLARAEAVRAAMVGRGIPATQLQAQGFGAGSPIANNDSDEGRARNRRIEFRMIITK